VERVPRDAPGAAGKAGRRVLSEVDSLDLLAAAGCSVVRHTRARHPADAVRFAAELGYPVVLKLEATGLAHKTDLGGVRVGLVDAAAVHAAAAELLAIELPGGGRATGLVVQPMARSGVELIVGLRRDAQFGPVVLVGLGGVVAEALDDVAIRLAPLTVDDALAMLGALRGGRLLDAFRGRPAIDRDAVADLVVHVASLALARPDIVEADLNPVIASDEGAVIVDALVVLADDR
jgi:acyl-CoA synthetase (NDP forming)